MTTDTELEKIAADLLWEAHMMRQGCLAWIWRAVFVLAIVGVLWLVGKI